MALPSLPTLLIAAGLALLSTLIVGKAKRAAPFGKRAMRVVGACGVVLLAVGTILHLGASPTIVPQNEPPRQTPARTSATAGACTFSFEPKTARWGEEVRIHMRPETEKVDVYLNGKPLPSKSVEKGTFAVTIPSISKSGYLMLDCAGTKVQAHEPLTVLPK